jgi:hypothetical protein
VFGENKMKLSTKQLKQIIKEELRSLLNESAYEDAISQWEQRLEYEPKAWVGEQAQLISLISQGVYEDAILLSIDYPELFASLIRDDYANKNEFIKYILNYELDPNLEAITEPIRLAYQYTANYIKNSIGHQPYDLDGDLKEEWEQNQPFFSEFQGLQSMKDPYEIVEKYKELLNVGATLEPPIKLTKRMLPVFVYHDPDPKAYKDPSLRDDEGDVVDVSSRKFVDIHIAHYLRALLQGESLRDPSTYK